MESYRLSKAWHLAHSVALEIRSFAAELPKSDHYNTHRDICRASAVVPMAIKESLRQEQPHIRLQHFEVAREATRDLHEVLMLAHEQRYIETALFKKLAQQTIEAQQILTGLIRAINQQTTA
jgi:four helix bundle protein